MYRNAQGYLGSDDQRFLRHCVSTSSHEIANAVTTEDFVKVRKLVESGVSPNTAKPSGETLLHFCALLDSVQIVKYLIEKGADINLAAKDGAVPLHYCMLRGDHNEVFKVLLSNPELQLNARTHELQETPLMWAVRKGDLSLAQALLDHGAGIDIPDADGITPMMRAGLEGNEPMLRLLLASGGTISLHIATLYLMQLDPKMRRLMDEAKAVLGTRRTIERVLR